MRTKGGAPEAPCKGRLEKIRPAPLAPPRWRLHLGDRTVDLTSKELFHPDRCWLAILLQTHDRPPFRWDRDDHREWLVARLAEVRS